jgi:hypothetical protein
MMLKRLIEQIPSRRRLWWIETEYHNRAVVVARTEEEALRIFKDFAPREAVMEIVSGDEVGWV